MRRGVRIGQKLMRLDNRYAALSSTEDAPGVQREKRALAPRGSTYSEPKISMAIAAVETNICHAGKSESVQCECATTQEKKVGVSQSEVIFHGADANSTSTDLVEHVAPSDVVPLQLESTVAGSETDCFSTAACSPTADSALQSASWLYKDQANTDTQKNHEMLDNAPDPIRCITKGETQFPAARPDDRRSFLDDFFGPQSFSIELPTNDITLAVPPATHQKQGWPSPTSSPAAPTTRDRKSRFFPTLPTVSPEAFKSDYGAQVEPHYSFPLLYHPPASTSLSFSTPAPSTTIKPRLKKSPPPPIVTSYSPLTSPIVIRQPPSYFDSCFNSNSNIMIDLQIPPSEGVVTSNDPSKHDNEKPLMPASQHPEPANQPQVHTLDPSRKVNIAERSPHRQETRLANMDRSGRGGKEVESLQAWVNGFFKTFDAKMQKDIKALEKLMRDIEARGRRFQQEAEAEAEALGRPIEPDVESWEGLEREFWKG